MKSFETPNMPSMKHSEIDTRLGNTLACLIEVIGFWI